MKDEVIAVFDLGEEEPMPTAGVLTFVLFKERGQSREPFLSAGQ